MNFLRITSVTRWLLVVIGCVVLATAQPMSAAAEETPAERSSGHVIYPKGSAADKAGAAGPKKESGSGSYVLVVALLLAATGGWVLFQRRQGSSLVTRGPRKLQIEETRPLGNRQYLVVANYEGRKMLLGVTTGHIQLLTHLEDEVVEEKA